MEQKFRYFFNDVEIFDFEEFEEKIKVDNITIDVINYNIYAKS